MITNNSASAANENLLFLESIGWRAVLGSRRDCARIITTLETVYKVILIGRPLTIRALSMLTGFSCGAVSGYLKTARTLGLLTRSLIRENPDDGDSAVLGTAAVPALAFADLELDTEAVAALLRSERTAERREWQKKTTKSRKAKQASGAKWKSGPRGFNKDEAVAYKAQQAENIVPDQEEMATKMRAKHGRLYKTYHREADETVDLWKSVLAEMKEKYPESDHPRLWVRVEPLTWVEAFKLVDALLGTEDPRTRRPGIYAPALVLMLWERWDWNRQNKRGFPKIPKTDVGWLTQPKWLELFAGKNGEIAEQHVNHYIGTVQAAPHTMLKMHEDMIQIIVDTVERDDRRRQAIIQRTCAGAYNICSDTIGYGEGTVCPTCRFSATCRMKTMKRTPWQVLLTDGTLSAKRAALLMYIWSKDATAFRAEAERLVDAGYVGLDFITQSPLFCEVITANV